MDWTPLITKYWGFLLFIAGLCFHAIWMYFQVGTHDKRISTLEKGKDDVQDSITAIREQISAIDGKLDILVDGYQKAKKK